MTAMYVKFTENNEWEGETWHFYIPTTGNEEALAKLAEAIGVIDPASNNNDSYWLQLDNPIPESEVDVLVKHSEVGYLRYHNKLTGTFALTDDARDRIHDGDDCNPLVRGGIREFMQEPF